MAAAYAALVSVTNVIHQIQNHPQPPIFLDPKSVRSLTEKVAFLQDFLESYSYHVDRQEADALESRIADAAYETEDVIESHIVDRFRAHRESNIRSNDDLLCRGLQKVVRDLELITRDVMEIKEKITKIELHGNEALPAGSQRSPPIIIITGKKSILVGVDNVLIKVMDKLTNIGQRPNRQIIPIVGMGGSGKTALARGIYEHPLIVQHFDLLVWVTISQEYSVREILVQSLVCLKNMGSREYLCGKTEHELGELLYKSLSGRRYLVVMDDLWGVEAWDRMKFFFPDYRNGSRVVITSRIYNVALYMADSVDVVKMRFLDEYNSWKLLRTSVFGKECCPPELEQTGKRIAKSCKGLPLSINVIGGMLSKHKQSLDYWEYVSENLYPILNSEDDEHCFKILRLSYMELPVHLKPCFLYMGIFQEDTVIPRSRLVGLWIAEGFLKPISNKSPEMVAEQYLWELVGRNLVTVHKLGSTGKIKQCKLHDLLRELCLKEATRNKFFRIWRPSDLQLQRDIRTQRRLGCPPSTRDKLDNVGPLQASSLRSLICSFGDGTERVPHFELRSLRALTVSAKLDVTPKDYSAEAVLQLANLRFLESFSDYTPRIPPSTGRIWNLQTLVLKWSEQENLPSSRSVPVVDIWRMARLRHIEFSKFRLPYPPWNEEVSLDSLQILKGVWNLEWCDDTVKRISNLKKLKVSYTEDDGWRYRLDNLCRLRQLESLHCTFHCSSKELGRGLVLPRSLVKLTLLRTGLRWEEMCIKIGPLPCLQVLKLDMDSFVGPEWVTVGGQFRKLRRLSIAYCEELMRWETDGEHFPSLERLVLRCLGLEKVPSEIGDITTLESIDVLFCSKSAVVSAKEILKEQEELGNVGFRLRIV